MSELPDLPDLEGGSTLAVHLGDGAYASTGRYRGEIVVTASHHDPRRASDVVYLGPCEVQSLFDFVRALERRREAEGVGG